MADDTPTSAAAPAAGRREGLRVYLFVLLAAGAIGAVAALSTGTTTGSSVVVDLEPFAVSSLFDPPGAERDLVLDGSGEVRQAVSAIPAAAATEAAGRTAAVWATADPGGGQVTIWADAGSARASMDAADAAAAAYLQLRVDNGIAQADGGIAAVTENLERLRAQRLELTDGEQRDTLDITIQDQEASLAQLQEARDRFDTDPLGSVAAGPSDPAADLSQPFNGLAVFLAAAVVLGTATWAWRRWRAPLRSDASVRRAGLPVSGVLRDEQDAAAYVLELRLARAGGRGTVLVVADPVPVGTAGGGGHALPFAQRLATVAARSCGAAVVEGDLRRGTSTDAGGPTLMQLREDPEQGALAVPSGRPLTVEAGGPHADPAGAVGAPQTAQAVGAVAATADIVVIAAPPVQQLTAVAWSGHADVFVVLAVEGVTRRADLRAATRSLARFGVEAELLVVAPDLALPSAQLEPAPT